MQNLNRNPSLPKQGGRFIYVLSIGNKNLKIGLQLGEKEQSLRLLLDARNLASCRPTRGMLRRFNKLHP